MVTDTRPAPLDELEPFRIDDPREITRQLRELVDARTVVHLYSPERDARPLAKVQITGVDERNRRLELALQGERTDTVVLDLDQATALAFPGSIKLQFTLTGLSAGLLAPHNAEATLPAVLYRVQRRSAFRVRMSDRDMPLARLRHPGVKGLDVELRVQDVSASGCALLVPSATPPIAAGARIPEVGFDLDADTHLVATVLVHHATPVREGLRLGCELLDVDGASQRALQRFVDLTQRRQRWASALI